MDGVLRFDWDIHNVGHLARHNVRPEEAEQALSGEIVDLDYRVTADGQERWIAMGRTTAGRILVIVWTVLDDGSYRPITAYPAAKELESLYYRAIQGEGTN
ncbi:MAG: BrnT family toxin [Bryobacteraceae bacterium]